MRRFSPFRFAPQGSSGSSFHGFSALRGLSGAWNRSRPTLSGLQSARTGSVLPDSTLFPLELIPENAKYSFKWFRLAAFNGEPVVERCEDFLGLETGRDGPEVGREALERELSSPIPLPSQAIDFGRASRNIHSSWCFHIEY